MAILHFSEFLKFKTHTKNSIIHLVEINQQIYGIENEKCVHVYIAVLWIWQKYSRCLYEWQLNKKKIICVERAQMDRWILF